MYILPGLAVSDKTINITQPLLPYWQRYYNLDYGQVSWVFAMTVPGYTLAAVLNGRIVHRFGRRGASAIIASGRICVYVITIFHPPYPVIASTAIISGFSVAVMDASYNSWIGGVMENSAVLLGCMHACYGLGSLSSPLVLGALVEYRGLPWWYLHYVLVSVDLLNCAECPSRLVWVTIGLTITQFIV